MSLDTQYLFLYSYYSIYIREGVLYTLCQELE